MASTMAANATSVHNVSGTVDVDQSNANNNSESRHDPTGLPT